MQLHDLLLKFFGLSWDQLEILGIVSAVDLRVVLAQFRLQGVRAEQGQSHKRAGQMAILDVFPQLQTQVVPVQHKQLINMLRIQRLTLIMSKVIKYYKLGQLSVIQSPNYAIHRDVYRKRGKGLDFYQTMHCFIAYALRTKINGMIY